MMIIEDEKPNDRVGRESLIALIQSGGPPAFILGAAIAFAEHCGSPTEREMARVMDVALKNWVSEHKKGLH